MSGNEARGRVGGGAPDDQRYDATTYAWHNGNSRANVPGQDIPRQSEDTARSGTGRHRDTSPVVAWVVTPENFHRPQRATVAPAFSFRETYERLADLHGRHTERGALFAVQAIEAGR